MDSYLTLRKSQSPDSGLKVLHHLHSTTLLNSSYAPPDSIRSALTHLLHCFCGQHPGISTSTPCHVLFFHLEIFQQTCKLFPPPLQVLILVSQTWKDILWPLYKIQICLQHSFSFGGFLFVFYCEYQHLKCCICVYLFHAYLTPLECKLYENKDFVLFATISPIIEPTTYENTKKYCYMNEWMNEHSYYYIYTHNLQLM